MNMSNFSKADRFTKSITSLLVGLTADKDDLQHLKVAFWMADLDNDGYITGEELGIYLRSRVS
jgi:Ca2+-binding EF-hand superfamily protein